MPIRLLRHILSLEKSTAACFQPPFAPIVQTQHWLTPTTRAKQTGALCVYTRRLEISQFMSEHVPHVFTIELCDHTQIQKTWSFLHLRLVEASVWGPQTRITWLKTAILASNHKTASVLPAFEWCGFFLTSRSKSQVKQKRNCNSLVFMSVQNFILWIINHTLFPMQTCHTSMHPAAVCAVPQLKSRSVRHLLVQSWRCGQWGRQRFISQGDVRSL